MTPACCHRHGTELVRVISRDGRCQVMERCLRCHGNARGPEVWVPQSSVPGRVEDLPVHKDCRPAAPRSDQPSLFGE